MDIVRRPIPAVFNTLKRLLFLSRWQQPTDNGWSDKSVTLYLSTVNYRSLQTIGKIRIRWVDDLSSHLDFDSATRGLSVFRFPTFCALNTLRNSRDPVFDGITRALFRADNETTDDGDLVVRASQEILMSYRLLFGQKKISRKAGRAELERLKRRDSHYDPLLDVICTQSHDAVVTTLPASLWPMSCRDPDDTLQEEDMYSAQDDFPIFGLRLAKLQSYNLRRQPNLSHVKATPVAPSAPQSKSAFQVTTPIQ
ncbi:MAG: hypothetical protein Q9172_001713 [Xanthocarpia lactea]